MGLRRGVCLCVRAIPAIIVNFVCIFLCGTRHSKEAAARCALNSNRTSQNDFPRCSRAGYGAFNARDLRSTG